ALQDELRHPVGRHDSGLEEVRVHPRGLDGLDGTLVRRRVDQGGSDRGALRGLDEVALPGVEDEIYEDIIETDVAAANALDRLALEQVEELVRRERCVIDHTVLL